MKQTRVKIAEATPDQLATFAAILGLEVKSQDKAELAALISSSGYQGDEITVIEDAPRASKAPESNDVLQRSEVAVWDGTDEFGIKRARRLIYIQIPNQDRPGGEQPVPAGVNGNNMHIKRNTPSLVPEEFIESLDHAIEKRYDPSPEDTKALTAPRYVQRYPFQRVPIPDESVLVNPHGKPYKMAQPEDVVAYKKKRVKAEMARDQEARERMKSKGLVA